VGLAGVDRRRPAASLSGGQATRAALAGLLASERDLLLLDEPTNNLDAEARALVAQVLAGWKGGAIVVSHDRGLPRQMDRIVDLTSLGAKVYWRELRRLRPAQGRGGGRRCCLASRSG